MAKTYFITRHQGAKDWAARKGFDAQIVEHFDVKTIEKGDVVLGTLPIHLAAEIWDRQGRYFHLVLNIPADLRGVEITADKMEELGATLEEFVVLRTPKIVP